MGEEQRIFKTAIKGIAQHKHTVALDVRVTSESSGAGTAGVVARDGNVVDDKRSACAQRVAGRGEAAVDVRGGGGCSGGGRGGGRGGRRNVRTARGSEQAAVAVGQTGSLVAEVLEAWSSRACKPSEEEMSEVGQ